jgi:transposase, IS30 family
MARPGFPVEVHRRFWQQVSSGVSVPDAGPAVGVSRATGERWFRIAGGVIPSLVKEPTGARLSFVEREEIAVKLAAGWGVNEIARWVERSASTISREIRRNSSGREGIYRASTAQERADESARRPQEPKLAKNPVLAGEVEDRLRLNHSPEQISARLGEDFPEDPEMQVSHETIYKSLFVQGRGGLKTDLVTHLRTGRALRKPRRVPGERRNRILDMVNISERPPEIEDRAVPGHWEGDLIIGEHSASAVGTLVERMTGFTMLLHLPENHSALSVQEAMIYKMAELPQLLRQTLTWDQGIEMANHAVIAKATDLAIYFCDPHSPWQRGSNENTNGLLRQYLPKSTDLSIHGPGILDNIASELNNRPRKRLGWRTPAEALDELLSNPHTHLALH